MEIPQLIIEAVKAATRLATVGVAALGLRTWRRQLHGTAEYERARKLYRAVLHVRDQLGGVRLAFITGGEMSTAFKEAGLEPDGGDVSRDKRTTGLVYERRFKRVNDAMTELQVELLDAEVLWGAAVREPERQLRQCMAELYTAVVQHVRSEQPGYGPDRLSEELRERYFNALYDQSTPEQPDDFTKRVNAAVSAFEALLRPHLNRRISERQPNESLKLTGRLRKRALRARNG